MEEVKHHWHKDSEEKWCIMCKKVNKFFYPSRDFEDGSCPFCGENARQEIDRRKRVKEGLKRQQEMREDLRKKNTLEAFC